MGTDKKQAAAKRTESSKKATKGAKQKPVTDASESLVTETSDVEALPVDVLLEEAASQGAQEEPAAEAKPPVTDTAGDPEIEAALEELAEAVKSDPVASDAAIRTRKIPKRVKRTAIGSFSLLVLLLAGGTAYTLYMDQQPAQAVQAVSSATVAAPKSLTPSKPSKNIPASVALTSFLTPLHRGDTTELYIHTVATATCTIVVLYNNVPYKGAELGAKVADDFGNVSWTWPVGRTTPLGDWPVTVTCDYRGKTAVLKQTLSVF